MSNESSPSDPFGEHKWVDWYDPDRKELVIRFRAEDIEEAYDIKFRVLGVVPKR